MCRKNVSRCEPSSCTRRAQVERKTMDGCALRRGLHGQLTAKWQYPYGRASTVKIPSILCGGFQQPPPIQHNFFRQISHARGQIFARSVSHAKSSPLPRGIATRSQRNVHPSAFREQIWPTPCCKLQNIPCFKGFSGCIGYKPLLRLPPA